MFQKIFLFWNTFFQRLSKEKMWNTRFSAMLYCQQGQIISRGGYKTPLRSKIRLFVIIVKAWNPLTIVRKSSILDTIGNLDPTLSVSFFWPKRLRKHFLIHLLLENLRGERKHQLYSSSWTQNMLKVYKKLQSSSVSMVEKWDAVLGSRDPRDLRDLWDPWDLRDSRGPFIYFI